MAEILPNWVDTITIEILYMLHEKGPVNMSKLSHLTQRNYETILRKVRHLQDLMLVKTSRPNMRETLVELTQLGAKAATAITTMINTLWDVNAEIEAYFSDMYDEYLL